MNVRVLLNPTARGCAARSTIDALHRAFQAAEMDYEISQPEDQEEMRRTAMVAGSGGCDAVVAAGGDGTVHAVVNGLIIAAGSGPTCPLGILPLGTGNDFSDMAGLPRDLHLAARVIAAGQTRRVDAGRVSFAREDGAGVAGLQSRYFVNNCAVAMEPLVTIETLRVKRLRGNARYVAGLLRGFLKLRSWHMRIAWDGGSFQAPTYLLSIANSPRTGGQFLVAPEARLDDGMLDLVFSPWLPRLEVLALLPRLFGGSHVRHPSIVAHRTSRVVVESDPATPIHADGEILCRAATGVSCQVLPGKITMLCP
jgi:diacylglycerol kinase (ATP)